MKEPYRLVKVEKIDPESWEGKLNATFPYPIIASLDCDEYPRYPNMQWKLREKDIRQLISDLEKTLDG